MDTIASSLQSLFSNIGPFFILLGLLIFVHELGHFLVAKFYGVRVEVFSLGFGKKIMQFKKGDTTYCISLIPLGGYVKMFGDDPTSSISEEEKKFSFLHKPVGQRIAIILAGPLMNFFFAAFIFTVIALMGQDMPGTTIGDLNPQTAAHQAGFTPGDTITHVNTIPVNTWQKLDEIIQDSAGKSLTFSVLKEDKNRIDISVTPKKIANPNVISEKTEVGAIEGLSLLSRAPIVGISNSESVAGKAGLPTLSLITKINGKKITYHREIAPALTKASLNSEEITVSAKSYRYKAEEEGKEIDYILSSAEVTALIDPNSELLTALGMLNSRLFLMIVKEGDPASEAGLLVGDQLLKIKGEVVTKWSSVVELVKSYKKGDGPIEIVVARNGEEITTSVTPEMTELVDNSGQDDHRFTIGIIPATAMVTGPLFNFKISNPILAVSHGFKRTIKWTKLVAMSFVRLVQRKVSTKNIGGIITIGKVAGDSFKAGFDRFLTMMAIISVNLFLLNLLPVPVLDGGHLVFFTVEALRGAPVSLKKMEIAQQIGLVLLISLMVFSLFNDISNLISSPW